VNHKGSLRKKKGLTLGAFCMKRRTNFDLYLKDQLRDPNIAKRYKKAGEVWDIVIQEAKLRKKSGLSQKKLAK
jgi:hypothetical protein